MPVIWTDEQGQASYYHDACAKALGLDVGGDTVDSVPDDTTCSKCKKVIVNEAPPA